MVVIVKNIKEMLIDTMKNIEEIHWQRKDMDLSGERLEIDI